MRKLRLIPLALVALLGAALMLAPVARAQAPLGAQPIYEVSKTTKVLTLTALATATQNSADLAVGAYKRVLCQYNQTAHTGSAQSTVINIYNKDATSGTYQLVLASAAYTTDAEQAAIMAGPGMPATSNVSANSLLTQTIRVSAVQSGSSSTVTGTVTCTFTG